MTPKTGILLTNTGTPENPSHQSVKKYLRAFLSDKRVVHLPHFIWLPILNFFILPFRAKRSAKLYQKIWTEQGSPMRAFMQHIQKQLQQQLNPSYHVEIGMHYSSPTIENALHKFQENRIENIIVIPLYPQYSNTTTASSYDFVNLALRKWKTLPSIYFVRDYASHTKYISALAKNICSHWEKNGKSQKLLISFHGIPERFVRAGDIYQKQCEETTQLLVTELCLSSSEWILCYQSQFGYDKWLQPSTQHLFRNLPLQGITTLDIVCPGFSVDCLETEEEIAMTGKKIFLEAGGNHLRYISALNNSEAQIELLKTLVEESI